MSLTQNRVHNIIISETMIDYYQKCEGVQYYYSDLLCKRPSLLGASLSSMNYYGGVSIVTGTTLQCMLCTLSVIHSIAGRKRWKSDLSVLAIHAVDLVRFKYGVHTDYYNHKSSIPVAEIMIKLDRNAVQYLVEGWRLFVESPLNTFVKHCVRYLCLAPIAKNIMVLQGEYSRRHVKLARIDKCIFNSVVRSEDLNVVETKVAAIFFGLVNAAYVNKRIRQWADIGVLSIDKKKVVMNHRIDDIVQNNIGLKSLAITLGDKTCYRQT